jgi:hypothetical protein
MDTVTWIGTVASVLALIASAFAWRRAGQARNALVSVQAPWKVAIVVYDASCLCEAIWRLEWPLCVHLAQRTRSGLADISKYLGARLSKEQTVALGAAADSLMSVQSSILRFSQARAPGPSQKEVQRVLTSAQDVLTALSELQGDMKRQGEIAP